MWQYEYLKKELIKRLADSDSTRMRKLLESEHMGDRTPSQFYRDLKKLVTPSGGADYRFICSGTWPTRRRRKPKL